MPNNCSKYKFEFEWTLNIEVKTLNKPASLTQMKLLSALKRTLHSSTIGWLGNHSTVYCAYNIVMGFL